MSFTEWRDRFFNETGFPPTDKEVWEAAQAAERERVLGWCAKVQAHHETKPKIDGDVEQAFVDGEACGAEDCIEAIRADGVWP